MQETVGKVAPQYAPVVFAAPLPPGLSLPCRLLRPVSLLGLSMVLLSMLAGCGQFHAKPSDKYVYVTAKQTVLRDRVAAVSNRTGTATNGEKLVVLDRARRFLKVRTPRGEVGWVEEKLTAGPEVADQFEDLGKKHAKDLVVATATARDEVYLHAGPGLGTQRFYRLGEGDKLELLERATVEKQTAAASARPKPPSAAKSPPPAAKAPLPTAAKAPLPPAGKGTAASPAGVADAGPPPPVMEDWWLVRDAKGQAGWIYGRMLDVAIPDTLARYAEGQRIVAAYVLGYADDPDSGLLDNGTVVAKIPEYVTVLSPYKAGLPYDFDQVRVFTWNVKKHRYETAFREHNIAGYLPVSLKDSIDPYGRAANSKEKLPSFTYRVLAGDAPMPDPDPVSGIVTPAQTVTKTYRLEGNICRRIIGPGPAPTEAHPVVEEKKAKKPKGRK